MSAAQVEEAWGPLSNIPIPDPSVVTAHEIAKVRAELDEQFSDRLDALSELLSVAGTGRHEKALLRIEAAEAGLLNLASLFSQKLATMTVRIDTADTYAAAMRDNAKEAAMVTRAHAKEMVDTAFAASKELTAAYAQSTAAAVAKSETATNKELDGIKALIDSAGKVRDAQTNNLTDRLNRGEGMFAGGKGIIGGAIALLTVFILGAGLFFTQHDRSGALSFSGAETKRVDDLIAVVTEQNRQAGTRMDAISARINALTAPAAPLRQ